jgi:hypothetical protein
MDYESILKQGNLRQQNIQKAQNNQNRGEFMSRIKLAPDEVST